MRTFINLLKWDLLLLAKYGILPVAIGIGALYIALIYFLNIPPNIIALLIFSDPSMMGFIFVGVMVLFEKQAGTSSALIVTPLRPWQYLLSKSISLTIPALIISIAMTFASRESVNLMLVIIAVFLTSVLFLLLGFIGAQRVKTFNQYILIIPMFIAPLSIPIIDYFGLWESPLMWIIPTQSSLVLLKAAFVEVVVWKQILSIFVLLLSIVLVWKWALAEYAKRMTQA